MSKKCLVFAAHPDDETNGIGGTLVTLKRAGWNIHIVYATLPKDPPVATSRREACENVSKLLGTTMSLWQQQDGALSVTDETRALAKQEYEAFQPDLVLVMSGNDVHPDHRAMSNIAMGPALQRGVNTEIFLYELCASGRHTNGDRPQTLGFVPTHYVDTTEVIEEAAQLQRCHTTEDPEAMVIGMRRMHALRANEANASATGFAEAFVRLTRVGALPDWLPMFEKTTNTLRSIGIEFEPRSIGL